MMELLWPSVPIGKVLLGLSVLRLLYVQQSLFQILRPAGISVNWPLKQGHTGKFLVAHCASIQALNFVIVVTNSKEYSHVR